MVSKQFGAILKDPQGNKPYRGVSDGAEFCGDTVDEWNSSGSVIGMPTCPYGFRIFQVKDNKNAARSHPISQSYKPKCKLFGRASLPPLQVAEATQAASTAERPSL